MGRENSVGSGAREGTRQSITPGLVSESEPLLSQDISTNTLLQRYRGPRAKTYFLSGHDHFQENFPLVRRDPGNIKDS